MRTMTIIDPSLCTDNLGDEIIMDAVNRILYDLFPETYFFRVPSHERLSFRCHQFIRKSERCFIGGTNLLSSRTGPRALWRLALVDTVFLRNAVCLGTGWMKYMGAPSLRTRITLGRVLDSTVTHSVRDSYTLRQLQTLVPRVVNTSCPTTWGLTPQHCQQIPTRKASGCVLTLTAWHADPLADLAMIQAVQQRYKNLYFFPQMQADEAYFRQFNVTGVQMISPTLTAFDQFLENEPVDFIGTRLHGGIRALQKGRRALIVSIDNRAEEIGRDIQLQTVKRGDIASIHHWIESAAATDILLPTVEIAAWRRESEATETRTAGFG